MAFLNNLNDVNELLKQKGLKPVAVEGYDLTITDEKLKEFESTQTESQTPSLVLSQEQQFIHQSIQDVIQHYRLDEVEGYYGIDEEEDEGEAEAMESTTARIRQGIHYQVLNQKRILWEFYKRNCYQQQQESYLTRFEELYLMAIKDVDAMVVN